MGLKRTDLDVADFAGPDTAARFTQIVGRPQIGAPLLDLGQFAVLGPVPIRQVEVGVAPRRGKANRSSMAWSFGCKPSFPGPRAKPSWQRQSATS